MTDFYEPLRERLRARGWRQVQRWKLWVWKRPDGAELDEAEAFRQLERLDQDEAAVGKDTPC